MFTRNKNIQSECLQYLAVFNNNMNIIIQLQIVRTIAYKRTHQNIRSNIISFVKHSMYQLSFDMVLYDIRTSGLWPSFEASKIALVIFIRLYDGLDASLFILKMYKKYNHHGICIKMRILNSKNNILMHIFYLNFYVLLNVKISTHLEMQQPSHLKNIWDATFCCDRGKMSLRMMN